MSSLPPASSAPGSSAPGSSASDIPGAAPLPPAGRAAQNQAIQAATKDVSTQSTLDTENRLILAAQKAEQNRLMKALILEKNQNVAGKANDIFVSDTEYEAIVDNRLGEAARLQLDIQDAGDEAMRMQEQHRMLDQQINLNLMYGIPIV